MFGVRFLEREIVCILRADKAGDAVGVNDRYISSRLMLATGRY